jgi:hypothetical protein
MLRFAWIFCWFVAAPLPALILIAAAFFPIGWCSMITGLVALVRVDP